MRHRPTYESWNKMIGRCTRPTSPRFDLYGGRGITVCGRWRDYDAFLADMGERPAGTTLDRIDPERGYEPGNVRWATWREQNNNRRNNRRLTFKGVTKTMSEWAREVGINMSTIKMRLRDGWTVEEALTRSVRRQKNNSTKEVA